jgi:hypothetical protein
MWASVHKRVKVEHEMSNKWVQIEEKWVQIS